MVLEQDSHVMVEYLKVQAEAKGDWMVEVLPHGMVCGVAFVVAAPWRPRQMVA